MNPDTLTVNSTQNQRLRPDPPPIHKAEEDMPAVPLGTRFNWGHQKTPSGCSLYPIPPASVFHRSLTQEPEAGNLWVDSSNTYEDARLSTQPYHADLRTMTAYSYDRKVPPGSFVSPKVFNLATHPVWRTRQMDRFQTASLKRDLRSYVVPKRGIPGAHRPTCVFVGFVEWTMERCTMTRGEMDRLMHHGCAAKYPCSRPATYEEYISHAISGLPQINRTKFDITFVGPGSEKKGPGVLDHKNTLFARKKIVFPGDRLDGSSGKIEIDDSSCWGRKTCIAVVYCNRIRKQPSLQQFGLLRKTLKSTTGGRAIDGTRSVPHLINPDETQWNSFPHLYQQTINIQPL